MLNELQVIFATITFTKLFYFASDHLTALNRVVITRKCTTPILAGIHFLFLLDNVPLLADTVGFEPTDPLRGRLLSRELD